MSEEAGTTDVQAAASKSTNRLVCCLSAQLLSQTKQTKRESKQATKLTSRVKLRVPPGGMPQAGKPPAP